ncbi:MAG: 2-C-methyl-D-erythritol 2,4-cyclodiphosphate synthase [Clostridia bacterium]|nr:2-C-methyl-D-erythritol 2,4-cyclodiphosphate synthase [Clostridia bacterium]
MSGIWAIVPAAGKGQRAGQGHNKVFTRIGGKAVLTRTLEALSASGIFDGCIIVIGKEDLPAWKEISEHEIHVQFRMFTAEGGYTRMESVSSGIRLLPEDCRIVAIHDAARPFITAEGIRTAIDSAQVFGSGVLCTPVTDTIKQHDENGFVTSTPERDLLWAAQTPQAFRCADIKRAYAEAIKDGTAATDDASLYERYIGKVHLVTCPDAVYNKKLTYPSDFMDAQRKLSIPRVGSGYDVHRLVKGRKLILCGTEIPYDSGLEGHSDADVAVHALMDALLGAAGLGDIGRLFPDSDMQYKDISSIYLLEQVIKRLHDAGMTVWNCDITIVAQKPKLSPYMEQMKANIADTLGIEQGFVNVKATTTEHLGFEGRGEGISSYAVCTII